MFSIVSVLDTFRTIVKRNENVISVEVHDTAISEEGTLEKIIGLLQGKKCLIFCYDVTNIGSLRILKNIWLPEADQEFAKDIPFLVCGNKLDLRDQQQDAFVANEVAENMLGKYTRIQSFMQCSALDVMKKKVDNDNENSVNAVFDMAINLALEYIDPRYRQSVCCVIL